MTSMGLSIPVDNLLPHGNPFCHHNGCRFWCTGCRYCNDRHLSMTETTIVPNGSYNGNESNGHFPFRFFAPLLGAFPLQNISGAQAEGGNKRKTGYCLRPSILATIGIEGDHISFLYSFILYLTSLFSFSNFILFSLLFWCPKNS